MLIEISLIVLASSLLIFHLIGRYNESYWKKRGVKFHGKNKVLGVFGAFFSGKSAVFELFGDLYKKYKNEPVVGIGNLFTPSVFVTNPKNIQHVLQLDFNSFNHRGFESEKDTLSDSILFMTGNRWKLMRQNMTPLFTTNKLKNMYYIMDRCAQDFVVYLDNNPKAREGKFYDTLNMFCNAAVCGAIFGIGQESTFDSPFMKMSQGLSTSNWKTSLQFALLSISPKLIKLLGIRFGAEYEKFFVDAITQVTKKREEDKVQRHDFADLAANLRKKGTIRDENTGLEIEPSFTLLSAQASFFFLAGVEPNANALFNTLVVLCQHPEILQKVHQEIDEHFEKNNNNIGYDVITQLTYLDKVLSESLRMFPPVGYVTRKCIEDSVLPVGEVKIEKGTKLYTPIYQLHHDPDLYPEPEVFDPERFSKDRKPNDDIYIPFGMGNRLCIGARYSRLQIMAGLVHVLRNYEIHLEQTGKIGFKPDILNVRLDNVDIKLSRRNIKA
ncbi:cytochrome P450 6B5-like [Trichoplusia ni]|uniref:unspecific monooxygenase n=1 Tax=Trichoplusia ni TaxID=7111 RepID=A0A7E5VE25_TRINI|nr:cytochrome P450 6B5-like [Trichoplusia ni]